MVIARGYRDKGMESCLTGIEFQFYKMKRIMELDGSGSTQYEST